MDVKINRKLRFQPSDEDRDRNGNKSETVRKKKDRWKNKWDFSLVPSHGNMKGRRKKDGLRRENRKRHGQIDDNGVLPSSKPWQ